MLTPSETFPNTRMRRLRQSPWIRDLVQEHKLTPCDLIWPIFLSEDADAQDPITALPGVHRYGINRAIPAIQKAADLGIKAIALFPATPPEKKTSNAAEAFNPDNLVCQSIQKIKHAVQHIGIITDIALDPYTSHGHDGLIDDKGHVLNDETLEALCKQALVQTQAGADILAPSDMMDGRIGVIRQTLEQHAYTDTLILSYAAKYASHFYGPFRDAVGSSGALKGDKKTYQMNPANAAEAIREARLDITEGADMLMVKPGLPYLDIIKDIKTTFSMPTFGYHVSGEYAMLKAAAEKGWLNYDNCLMETLLSFKRAGCDGILTYGACDAAQLLQTKT